MKVQCRQCLKTFDIPGDRVATFDKPVAFPCPACSALIELGQTGEEAGHRRKDSAAGTPGEILKKRILRTVKDLPPMPQVAEKARRIVADDSSSFADLARVIVTDQAIAARVLKLANSSFYGVMGTVASVQHAAVVLGMRTLNELITLACASSLLGSELKGYGMQPGDLWSHSLAAAECARDIAQTTSPELGDDAFAAGLLHDCGKLILNKYVFERLDLFEQQVREENRTVQDAEKRILGFDHAQVAADVCSKWSIPNELTTAIRYHHQPLQQRNNQLVLIVHAADAIALMRGAGDKPCAMDSLVTDLLGLDDSRIAAHLAHAEEYVDSIVGSFA